MERDEVLAMEEQEEDEVVTEGKMFLEHFQQQQKQSQLKRRWLMGLPISKSEKETLSTHKCLLESFVREDDLFPEIMKRCIGEIRGAYPPKRASVSASEDSAQVIGRTTIKQLLARRLHCLNNKGMQLVASSLARGPLVNFLSTRKQMKKTIKETLPKLTWNDRSKLSELSQILSDPENVKENCFMTMPSSRRASAVEILDSLEHLPTEALLAMHRVIKGKPPNIPRLQPTSYGYSRSQLIDNIRELSYDDDNELPSSSLAKALAIAGLSFKYIVGRASPSLTYFVQFSRETLALQCEIAKAITLIGSTKFRVPELRSLQHLLDPEANVPNGSLRTSLKSMLTEYLFECSDMRVPKSLSDALAIVNESSRGAPHGFASRAEIEEEVERVLNLSACMKQVVWHHLPESQVDEDFADAYIEELEESEEEDDNTYKGYEGCDKKNDQEEHVAENTVLEDQDTSIVALNRMENQSTSLSQELMSHLPLSTSVVACGERSSTRLNKMKQLGATTAMDERSPHVSSPSCSIVSTSECVSNSVYLGIQQACDETSMVAYNLVGYIMEDLADNEGLELGFNHRSYLRANCSTQETQEKQAPPDQNNVAASLFLRAVKELLPSLSKSEMEELKDLMGA